MREQKKNWFSNHSVNLKAKNTFLVICGFIKIDLTKFSVIANGLFKQGNSQDNAFLKLLA